MIEALRKRHMPLALALAAVAGMPSGPAASPASPPSSPAAMEINNPLHSPVSQQPCDTADLLDALRELIAEPRLAAYFHLDQPDRAGLEVVDDDDRLRLGDSTTLAKRTVVSPPHAVRQASRLRLHVSALVCQSSALSLSLRLPDEGLHGHAQFTRQASTPWVLTSLTLAEH